MKKGGGGLVEGGFSVKFLVRCAYYAQRTRNTIMPSAYGIFV